MTNARTRLLASTNRTPGIKPLRGQDLFANTSYPTSWEHYVGQDKAVKHLKIAAYSAKARFARLDHVLIAAGGHGIGKSAIVRLIAKEMDAGLVEVQGAIEEKEAVRILRSMQDGDILFWDEFHQAVSKGAAKAEWLLSFLQDGVIISNGGAIPVPNVTVVAATTDAQKLQETIISRFPLRPGMDEYSTEQAMQIGAVTAASMLRNLNTIAQPSPACLRGIAEMANNNPRAISQVLRNLRDMILAGAIENDADGNYDLDEVADLMGITRDGLDDLAQRYLIALVSNFSGKPAGEKAIAAVLGEPTPPRHTEKLLIGKGFVSLTPQGRQITIEGQDRFDRLVEEVKTAM